MPSVSRVFHSFRRLVAWCNFNMSKVHGYMLPFIGGSLSAFKALIFIGSEPLARVTTLYVYHPTRLCVRFRDVRRHGCFLLRRINTTQFVDY